MQSFNDENIDGLNEETFGDEDFGDWEADHDIFVKENDSFAMESKHQQSFEKDRGFNLSNDIENSLIQLVSEDVEYIDPAILTVTKPKQLRNGNRLLNNSVAFYPPMPDLTCNPIWDSTASSVSTTNGSIVNQLEPDALELAKVLEEMRLEVLKSGKPNFDMMARLKNMLETPSPTNMVTTSHMPPGFNFDRPMTTSTSLLSSSTSSTTNPPSSIKMLDTRDAQDKQAAMREFFGNESLTLPAVDDDPAVIMEESSTVEDEFNPKLDDWMGDYQKQYVLRFQQRSIDSLNPYVTDYYYTVQLMRQKMRSFAHHVGRLPNHLKARIPSPLHYMPAPLDANQLYLMGSDHPHMQSLQHKFVLTANDEPPPTMQEQDSSIVASSANNLNGISNLGRPTKSNFQTQRIIAELSVASVLTDPSLSTKNGSCSADSVKPSFEDGLDGDDELEASSHATIRSSCTTTSFFPSKTIYAATSIGYTPDMQSLNTARKRRLVLARIERMYSLILNLDETQFSITRIVAENMHRMRLMQHYEMLLKRLHAEFYHRPAGPSELVWVQRLMRTNSPILVHVPYLDILTVSKGVRLFGIVLGNLDAVHLQIVMSYLISNFTWVIKNLPISITDFSATLHTSFRRVAYSLADVLGVLAVCLPPELIEMAQQYQETAGSLEPRLSCDRARNALAFMQSSLGLTFVFCLLDGCALRSNPEDPSEFVYWSRSMAYVVNALAFDCEATGSNLLLLEPLPRLASILKIYLDPKKSKLPIGVFERLMRLVPVQTNLDDSQTPQTNRFSHPSPIH